MIAESSPKHSAISRAMAKPLKRGRACMNCRFLKIKCDGVKPVCGPCRKHPKDDECEYSDGPGRSRTKAIEDENKVLRARVYELEHPEESTPSVILHDPYSLYHESLPKPSPSLSMQEARPFDPSSPFSSASSSSSLPSNQPWRSFSVGSSAPSSSPHRQYTSSPFLGAEEPEPITIQSLLDRFLPYCQEFGFFLDSNKFREATLLPLPPGHPSRPSPAVVNAIYLWGAHLSQSQTLLQQEPSFVSRALQHVVLDRFGSHPDVILHTLQAEILLSYYFLRTGRFIEAKCHTATAVSLALGAGLHKTKSVHSNASSVLGLSSNAPISLPPPRDSTEEGERINGFWAVLVLHKLMMVALEPPESLCGTLEAPGIQVDTPWPLEISDYSKVPFGSKVHGNNTIRNFLLGIVDHEHLGHSITALNVKAAILFHKSVQLSGQQIPNVQPQFNHYMAAVQSIRRLVDSFRSMITQLTRFDIDDTKNPYTRTVLLICALADAAMIKLHIHFRYSDSASEKFCLEAAQRIVTFGNFNIQEIGHMNPIMSTLCATACHVFITGISRLRSSENLWPVNAEQSEGKLMEGLKRGMAILSARSDESAFTKYQLTKIQEAFSAIK